MSLSQNIKRLRLERNMTQEQLASALGVSTQAVSKWETRETYPDGTLLVPLAKLLEVSLDELFDHDAVSMEDLSHRIVRLMRQTKASERFRVAREIGWQVQRGMCGCFAPIDARYDPDDLGNRYNSSYILDDHGFTVISNGNEPFFSVFPEPEEGFGHFLGDRDAMQGLFAALSSRDTMNALIYLYRHRQNYVFESAVLARECEIAEDRLADVIEDLLTLRVIWSREICINGEVRTLYYSRPSHKLIALFLVAREVGYKGAHCMQLHNRNKPLLK